MRTGIFEIEFKKKNGKRCNALNKLISVGWRKGEEKREKKKENRRKNNI